MPRSARLTPAIAGLVIWFFTCSQVSVLAGVAYQATNNDKPEVSKSTVSKKSKRKKKKKKTVSSIPYLGFGVRPPVETKTTPAPVAQVASTPASSKGASRAERSSKVRIVPAGKTPVSGAPSFAGSNASPITIDSINPDPEPLPAIPFPSDIEVIGLAGIVNSVTVTINGLSHSSPDDLDMLLVAPNGTTFHLWSDVGGTSVLESVTVTLSDTGSTLLPDDGPIISGTTYRPFNNDTAGDEFPLPAPGPPYGEPLLAGGATFASLFNGLTGDQASGTWSLYVSDDTNGNGGTISGGWTLNISTQIPSNTAGQLIISEFRTSGTLGPTDEYIELYNTTGAPLLVQASDVSSGLGVTSSDGIVRCVVPNGTLIPANGHYLCANGGGGNNTPQRNVGGRRTAVVDTFFSGDIPQNAGLAIFSSSISGPGSQNVSTRLDAVGPTSEVNTLFKEGTGYPPIEGSGLEYAFYRDMRPNGIPRDTGDNAADFIFVETNGNATVAGQRLGAPGFQGLADPRTTNDAVVVLPMAPCLGAAAPPNRVRSLVSDPQNNSTFGTISVRRAVTNITANAITTLRFRVFEITTFPAPSGIADLRFRTSVTSSEADACGGMDPVNILGITLDGPSQPMGGGYNSSGTVTLQAPLESGETVFVDFLFGVQQTGSFRIVVNIETLP